jgi:hypothetical protein
MCWRAGLRGAYHKAGADSCPELRFIAAVLAASARRIAQGTLLLLSNSPVANWPVAAGYQYSADLALN